MYRVQRLITFGVEVDWKCEQGFEVGLWLFPYRKQRSKIFCSLEWIWLKNWRTPGRPQLVKEFGASLRLHGRAPLVDGDELPACRLG